MAAGSEFEGTPELAIIQVRGRNERAIATVAVLTPQSNPLFLARKRCLEGGRSLLRERYRLLYRANQLRYVCVA
jgi:hypothetical protein